MKATYCLKFTSIRINNPLYPTWFRWKIPKTEYIDSMAEIFISHMVQMKVAIFLSSVVGLSTFISHMVQMKAKVSFELF